MHRHVTPSLDIYAYLISQLPHVCCLYRKPLSLSNAIGFKISEGYREHPLDREPVDFVHSCA